MQDLEGGELAASLTPTQRMDMVSRGYNPMSPNDVQRFFKNQRPVDGLGELAGVNKYKNLGGGTVDSRDSGLLNDLSGEDRAALTDGLGRLGSGGGNPREDIKGMMEGYGSGIGNLDDKISRISEKAQNNQQQRRLGPGPDRQQSQDRRLIAAPRQALPIVTEGAKAKKVGYTMGLRYINAFIDNIKNPSSTNRAALMKEMNSLVLIEDKIDPAIIKEYRQGIAIAEAELYAKIKTK
jgi:hypothetical protein